MKNLFASLPEDTSRINRIEPDKYRNDFQRDRDRILYSKEFRRLSGKTQVFASGFDDNMRTRLTHTLEVAQIANTISTQLGLNLYLTEAIALGHDVGHTPFGHVGERTLNFIMNGCDDKIVQFKRHKTSLFGFKHNLQAIRVVTQLEKTDNENGLNLTKFTLWGIQNHTSTQYKKKEKEFNCQHVLKHGKTISCEYKNNNKCYNRGSLHTDFYNQDTFYEGNPHITDENDWNFEGAVVAIADEIAQRHHDIEDGILAGLIAPDRLYNKIKSLYDSDKDKRFIIIDPNKLEQIKSKIIHNKSIIYDVSKLIIQELSIQYINSLHELFSSLKTSFNIKKHKDFCRQKKDIYIKWHSKNPQKPFCLITDFPPSINKFNQGLEQFLKQRILLSELAQKMDGKAQFIIRKMFQAYMNNPQQLPNNTILMMVSEIRNRDISEMTSGEAREYFDQYMHDADKKKRTSILPSKKDL